MFKNMRLVILFDMLLDPSFKMTTGFTNMSYVLGNYNVAEFVLIS